MGKLTLGQLIHHEIVYAAWLGVWGYALFVGFSPDSLLVVLSTFSPWCILVIAFNMVRDLFVYFGMDVGKQLRKENGLK